MEKNYTQSDYLRACGQANKEGKIVQLVQKEITYDVEVLEWNYEDQEIEQQKIDPETGELLFDDDGNPIMEIVTVRVRTTPIMVEEEITNPETGEKEIVIVQKHHTETRTKVVESIEIVEDTAQFEREFFNTSLGYVRRKVHMQDGTERNFLADVLPVLQIGVNIITYTKNGTQTKVPVTEEFINECKMQYLRDFYGNA